MAKRGNLGTQVTGPTVALAAKVKAALEALDTDVEMSYGTFYVRSVELAYRGGGMTEIVGYLVPDEGDGSTYDFWTPEKFGVEVDE